MSSLEYADGTWVHSCIFKHARDPSDRWTKLGELRVLCLNQQENQKFVKELRELADFIETSTRVVGRED